MYDNTATTTKVYERVVRLYNQPYYSSPSQGRSVGYNKNAYKHTPRPLAAPSVALVSPRKIKYFQSGAKVSTCSTINCAA